MARYIVDTEELREAIAKVPVQDRGDFLRAAITKLHDGTGNYPWAVRIKGKGKEKSEYSDAFEGFWSAYPKKVGKGGAFKSWKKTKIAEGVLLEKCLKALRWQVQMDQWRKDNGQFIPNPQTYLNNSRFDDDMPPELDPTRERKTITTMDGREIEV